MGGYQAASEPCSSAFYSRAAEYRTFGEEDSADEHMRRCHDAAGGAVVAVVVVVAAAAAVEVVVFLYTRFANVDTFHDAVVVDSFFASYFVWDDVDFACVSYLVVIAGQRVYFVWRRLGGTLGELVFVEDDVDSLFEKVAAYHYQHHDSHLLQAASHLDFYSSFANAGKERFGLNAADSFEYCD